jgi:hypothetical protein
MIGISNSQNLEKSVRSKGVVIFATNTAETDYVGIAEQNARLIKHYMGLPTTIVSATDTGGNKRFSTDTGTFVEWKNFGRHEAYAASPYDDTIVLDADYLIFDNSLLRLFGTDFDYLLCDKNRYVNIEQQASVMGPHSLPYVWATAFMFRKTERARLFFEMVAKVRRNYDYYRLLYNIREGNFRNDYAFAIAHYILNGNSLVPTSFAPIPIVTVTGTIEDVLPSGRNLVIRTSDKGYVLPFQNLHVMSKAWLTSPKLTQLVDQCLDNSLANKAS